MAMQLVGREPEGAVTWREGVVGMIADHNQAAVGAPGYDDVAFLSLRWDHVSGCRLAAMLALDYRGAGAGRLFSQRGVRRSGTDRAGTWSGRCARC